MSSMEEIDLSRSRKNSYTLFNLDALKSNTNGLFSGENPTSSSCMSPLTEENFVKRLINPADANESFIARKRGRKPKQKKAKNLNDKDITLKEILEDYQSGIPTRAEIKQREEKLEKLKQSRKTKKDPVTAALEAVTSSIPSTQKSTRKLELLEEPESSNPFAPRIVLKDGKPVIEQTFNMMPLTMQPTDLEVVTQKTEKLNSMSFKSRNHTAKWTEEETRKFYKVLALFGSDFSMIANVFRDRTRIQLKNKFHREEKTNPQKIDAAFAQHKKLNLKSFFEQNYNKDPEAAKLNANLNPESTTKEIYHDQSSNSGPARKNARLLAREHSASSSLDSMDISIIEEIKEILNLESKEMKKAPKNPFASTISSTVATPNLKPSEPIIVSPKVAEKDAIKPAEELPKFSLNQKVEELDDNKPKNLFFFMKS